jgi:hypothetical protein
MQRRSCVYTFLIAIGAVVLVHVSTNAAITYSISPVSISAQPGDIGDSFDVLLTNSGPAAVAVAGFNFEVSVADPDITLTGADYTTVAEPYIFAGNSLFQDSSIPLNFVNADGYSPQILDAGDVANDGVGTTVGVGQSVDLGQVLFDVSSPAQTGPFAVTFSGEVSDVAAANNLSTPDESLIDVDSFSGGTIVVASSVPEPSSLIGVVLVLMAVVGPSRRRTF